MAQYGLPVIDDLGGLSLTDAKEIGMLGGVGAAALLLGDLTGFYSTLQATPWQPKYVQPLLRVALGVGAYYGLRNYSPTAAMVAAGSLVGSGLYQLVRTPIMGVSTKLGDAMKAGLGDILVEDSRPLLGQLTYEERRALDEVRQDEIHMLPPALNEIQEDATPGIDEIAFAPPGLNGLEDAQSFSWMG